MAKLTVLDLGRIKKEEYPGEFDNFSDLEVGRNIKLNNPGKYNEYQDLIDPPLVPESKQEAEPRSLAAKGLDVLNRTVNVAADPTARLLSRGAEALTSDPNKKQELRSLRDSKDVVFASDVLERLVPALKSSAQQAASPQQQKEIVEAQTKAPKKNIVDQIMMMGNVPAGGQSTEFIKDVAKTGAKVGVDVAADPLSYLTFGTKTLLGQTIKAAYEAKIAGKTVKLDSQLARNMAKELGYAKPSPRSIREFFKKYPAPGKTVTERLANKETSLISANINPLAGEGGVPLLTGEPAAKLAKPFSMLKRSQVGAKIEKGVRDLLSTKSGDPEFDNLYSSYRDLAMHRAGLEVKDTKLLNKQIEKLSRELGIPRDQIVKNVNNVIESAIPLTKKQAVARYGKDVHDALIHHYNDKLVDAQVALKNAHRAGNQVEVEKWAKEVVDYQGELNHITGKYTKPPSLDPELDPIIKEVRERNERQLFRDQTSGVRVTPLLADVEYLPHILTPEARKRIIDQAIKDGTIPSKLSHKEQSDFLANSLRREFSQIKPKVIDAWKDAGIITPREALSLKSKKGLKKLDKMLDEGRISEGQFTDAMHTLTIDEVNQLGRDGKLGKKFGTDPIKETFHVDPVYHTTIRGMRGEVARTTAEFYNELKARGLAMEATKAPANWVKVKPSELNRFKTSPEIARVLNKYHDFSVVPNEFKGILRQYDKFHSLMKAWTLAPFPAYHLTNMVGNFWNNWLAGVNSIEPYADAVKIQLGKGKVKFKDVYGTTWTNDEIRKAAQEHGVVDKGWYGRDHTKSIQQELEGGKWLTLSSRNHLLRGGLEAGKQIENNARMAHFIDRLRKGDNVEAAAASVKKFLFDYGDLTDVEKNVMNRAFFFYTWTRKNIPLQLQHLVTEPGKFSVPFKISHEIEKNVPGAPEAYLPEYMKENFPTRIKYNNKTGEYTYFLAGRWLPVADIVKLMHLHEVAANMIAPLPKEILQQAFNIDFLTHKPIEKFKGEKGELFGKREILGVPVTKRIVHGAKIIRMLNEIDKMTKEDSDMTDIILGLTTGKTYNFNPRDSRVANKFRVDEERKVLQSGLIAAKRKGDMKEVARIKAMIQEKAKEY